MFYLVLCIIIYFYTFSCKISIENRQSHCYRRLSDRCRMNQIRFLLDPDVSAGGRAEDFLAVEKTVPHSLPHRSHPQY